MHGMRTLEPAASAARRAASVFSGASLPPALWDMTRGRSAVASFHGGGRLPSRRCSFVVILRGAEAEPINSVTEAEQKGVQAAPHRLLHVPGLESPCGIMLKCSFYAVKALLKRRSHGPGGEQVRQVFDRAPWTYLGQGCRYLVRPRPVASYVQRLFDGEGLQRCDGESICFII